MLITGVDPGGSCAGVLRPGDVLMALDGHSVGADGTSELKSASEGLTAGRAGVNQRVLFGHFANLSNVGDTMGVEVVRDRTRMALEIWCVMTL